MKKLSKLLCILLSAVMLLTLSVAIGASTANVEDEADIIDSFDESDIQEVADEIKSNYGYNVYILTNKSYSGTITEYVQSYYSQKASGGGAVLYICMNPSDREFRFIFFGSFKDKYGYTGYTDSIQSRLQSYLSSGEYDEAAQYFVNQIRTLCANPDTVPSGSSSSMDSGIDLTTVIISIVIGLACGFGFVAILMKNMKKVKVATTAQQYVVPGSFDERVSRDHFLYETVSRVRVHDSDEDHGGHGGGGGSPSDGGGGHF